MACKHKNIIRLGTKEVGFLFRTAPVVLGENNLLQSDKFLNAEESLNKVTPVNYRTQRMQSGFATTGLREKTNPANFLSRTSPYIPLVIARKQAQTQPWALDSFAYLVFWTNQITFH